MSDSILKYVCGKGMIASWIVRQMPEHHCYVEVFGGGAYVLMEKKPSSVEVYNDIDGDLVNVFRVLKYHPEELKRCLDGIPYSREIYRKFVDEWKAGYKGETDIHRA